MPEREVEQVPLTCGHVATVFTDWSRPVWCVECARYMPRAAGMVR